MRSYGQFCPIAKAAELFCERWTALVIRSLAAGAERFSDIQRGVPLMSPTLLSARLRQLEAEGIVGRSRDGRHWRYRLTPAGRDFVPLLGLLGQWGRRWTRRELEAGEIDLGLLIWGLEHAVDGAAFGPGRSLVELCVTDQPDHKAHWWFLNRDGGAELCVTDPGFGVDLYLSATLPDLIHVYRGDVSVAAALESGRLEALGPAEMRWRLAAWLNLGPLAEVPQAGVARARAGGAAA